VVENGHERRHKNNVGQDAESEESSRLSNYTIRRAERTIRSQCAHRYFAPNQITKDETATFGSITQYSMNYMIQCVEGGHPDWGPKDQKRETNLKS
tara:strand:- start:15969 stop:16256 length:288 start_codon:yes stop_codon:yes gene_type:complete